MRTTKWRSYVLCRFVGYVFHRPLKYRPNSQKEAATYELGQKKRDLLLKLLELECFVFEVKFLPKTSVLNPDAGNC